MITDGKWEVVITGSGPVVIGNDTLVAVLGDGDKYPNKETEAEENANANLIAAAPELLAACKLALRMATTTCSKSAVDDLKEIQELIGLSTKALAAAEPK